MAELIHLDAVVSDLERPGEFTKKLKAMLQNLGNFHVLEISREISLLREIKDIRNELDITAVVFEDQGDVMRGMERICRTMGNDSGTAFGNVVAPDRAQPKTKVVFRTSDSGGADAQLGASDDKIEGEPATENKQNKNPNNAELEDMREDAEAEDQHDTNLSLEDRVVISKTQFYNSNISFNVESHSTTGVESERPANEIWGKSSDPKHSSLPLVTLQLSVDDIERMARRAKKANQALDFLVDLKQKQSNVMDARSARIQAEQSLIQAKQTLKMSKDSDKQGKTTMAFTIVTIVFLPLSFMTSFFALDITQFWREDGGGLNLGYVLGIMLFVSAVVSGGFIYVAFKTESFHKVLWALRPGCGLK